MPSQVFVLLETLYSSFDNIARKLGVFKVSRLLRHLTWLDLSCLFPEFAVLPSTHQVETIGDCYMAATGKPYLHAVKYESIHSNVASDSHPLWCAITLTNFTYRPPRTS